MTIFGQTPQAFVWGFIVVWIITGFVLANLAFRVQILMHGTRSKTRIQNAEKELARLRRQLVLRSLLLPQAILAFLKARESVKRRRWNWKLILPGAQARELFLQHQETY